MGVIMYQKDGWYHWFPKIGTCGFSNYAKNFYEIISAVNNVGRGQKIPNVAHPAPLETFDHLMMDFVELTP